VIQLLKSHNGIVVMVPAGCTSKLQVLDVSVNRAFKNKVMNYFQQWYSSKVAESLKKDPNILNVKIDVSMNVIKPLNACWITNSWIYIKDNPNIILNGFRKVGLMIDNAMSSGEPMSSDVIIIDDTEDESFPPEDKVDNANYEVDGDKVDDTGEEPPQKRHKLNGILQYLKEFFN
jgi:hypothetical protein